jgi:ribonuclease HI
MLVTKMSRVITKVYSDGGSRGNPGPAACAFIVVADGVVIYKQAKFLGKRTNNEAEYQAVVMAMKWLESNANNPQQGEIQFCIDSELVVKQLNGVYKVKSNNLKPFIVLIKRINNKLDNRVKFVFLRRENNKLADALVNIKLNENRPKATSVGT